MKKTSGRFSKQERAEIEQLIRAGELSYPQIAERFHTSRFCIMDHAKRIGVVRPRGTANVNHPWHQKTKEQANGPV